MRNIFSIVKQESPILYWIVIIMFMGAIGCLSGLVLDNRIVMGINVWIKPFKFFMSTGIYVFTVGFLITLYPYSSIKKHVIRNVVSWTLVLEVFIIAINVLIIVVFVIDTIRLKLETKKSIQWAIL